MLHLTLYIRPYTAAVFGGPQKTVVRQGAYRMRPYGEFRRRYCRGGLYIRPYTAAVFGRPEKTGGAAGRI